MKRPARVQSPLSESLHKRLSAYALAASAAGVGMLALARPTEAKIVYTPAHVTIGPNHAFALDLNHDGRADFTIHNYSTVTTAGIGSWFLAVAPSGSYPNKIFGGLAGSKFNCSNFCASALPFGMEIRQSKRLEHERLDMVFVASDVYCAGPWADVSKRYLGLEFTVKGERHFGWARLNVGCKGLVTATLTGYAYETIPNKPIIAGKTHGKDEAALGHLATGGSGIPAWRVKPTAATTH